MTDKKHPLDGIPHGTRIRVTYEGVVSSSRIMVDDAGNYRVVRSDTVEIIEPPYPEWWPPQIGDVVLLDGVAWQRLADGFWNGYRADENFRHATLIARDGKPYPPREDNN